MTLRQLTFLKLGGSLITDKQTPLTARTDTIQRITSEIAFAVKQDPSLQLVIGHGSGSFGHAVASQHHTHSGGEGERYWQGFAEVWAAARALNEIVIHHLVQAGLPVIAFPPSAGVTAASKKITHWDKRPFASALSHNLIPIVQGDVIFDRDLGGSILSTEEVFLHLADDFKPERVLLAGLDKGIYANPEQPSNIIPRVSPSTINEIFPALSGAKAADVTGGMLAKVQLMLSLVQTHPDLTVHVFSGEQPGNIQKALAGEVLGTLISA